MSKIRPTCLIGLELPPDEVLSGNLSEESMQMIRQKLSADNESSLEKEQNDAVQVTMQCHVRKQAVSDKSVADCVESLLGTYLLSDGIQGAVKFLEWLKVIPPQDNFAAYLTKTVPTVITEGRTTEAEVNRVMDYCRDDIEKILNYKFKDPSFLLEALSHPSYIRNRLTRSYERLEFLGDAILDFLITSHIFERCPSLKPGDLTDLRSALVNNVTFASYVVRIGLHKYICYQLNPPLETAIMAFIEHQERREHKIQEDVLYLIDEEDCMIAEYVEVPKVLSDIFESLAGAIYLDSGGDLKTVWSVFYRIMCNEIDTFSRNIPIQPVRLLYENMHACPHIGTILFPNENLQKVMVPITITKNGKKYTVYGCGGNKFQAKRAAAKLALKVLGI
ncbi:ribonuclease III domain-containing protein [Phthorimaea operculella]|nr:ribonuclease III domain-containing protein [Phthorimaea operculella]